MRLGYFIISFYKERVFVKKLIFLFLFGLFSLNLSAQLPIVRAIEAGDLNKVIELIDEVGIDINILIKRKYKDYTETLLHRAIYEDKPEIVHLLIEKFKKKGISIDKMGTCKESALMYACSVGLNKYAKMLINEGADINFDNGEGVTPFICAVFAWGPIKNRIKCCKLLKKAGAEMSLRLEDLDEIIEYPEDEEVWGFARKNMTIGSQIKFVLCRFKAFLYKVLPDGDF